MTTDGVWALIQQEHLAIREQLLKIPKADDLKPIIEWLWTHVEEHHHHQEEVLLFTVLGDQPRLREGGPMCMYFYGMHMANPPLARAIETTKTQPEWQEHHHKFRQQNSPLLIPIDEHRASRHILQHIRQNQDHWDDKTVRALLQTYSEIQTMNMDKEESCLIHLSRSILTPEQERRIAQQWRKWD